MTLVAGPTALATPVGVRRVAVQTARQMHAAVMQALGRGEGGAGAPRTDVFVAVAAVAVWLLDAAVRAARVGTSRAERQATEPSSTGPSTTETSSIRPSTEE